MLINCESLSGYTLGCMCQMSGSLVGVRVPVIQERQYPYATDQGKVAPCMHLKTPMAPGRW